MTANLVSRQRFSPGDPRSKLARQWLAAKMRKNRSTFRHSRRPCRHGARCSQMLTESGVRPERPLVTTADRVASFIIEHGGKWQDEWRAQRDSRDWTRASCVLGLGLTRRDEARLDATRAVDGVLGRCGGTRIGEGGWRCADFSPVAVEGGEGSTPQGCCSSCYLSS